jgi:NarL family two-component system response regulator YdfI
MTRVLVAAGSAVTRAGLEAILARDPSFTVVGDAEPSGALTDEVGNHEPDVVLLEWVDHASGDAVAALRVLGIDADESARATPAVVVLTDELDASHVADLFDVGVRAVLSRDASAAEIIAAIGAAAAGLVVLGPELGTEVRKGLSADRATANARGTDGNGSLLSSRELEVLRMIAEGLANKQIAARLGISEHTVKFHVGSVFTKMGASTRAEAVMIGARRGLIVL